MIKIIQATTSEHFRQARLLFEEYAASLDFELDFQDFDIELIEMHTMYAPPDGCLLLALMKETTAGCVALRKLSTNICEMKRLFVKPGFRGKGIGKALAEHIICKGKKIGYHRMRLDTVPSMANARSLYRSLGFQKIDPYRFNPIKGTSYMELKLAMSNDQ